MRPDTQIRERPGWYQVITPSDATGSMNEVMWGDLPNGQEQAAIDAVFAEYAAHGVPFKWCVWPWTQPPDLATHLQARGMTSWGARGMTLATDAQLAPGDVQVHPIDPASALDYAAVWAQGWGDELSSVQRDVATLLASPTSHLFVARADNEPIGIASYQDRADSGYLLGAVVLEPWRGRGAYRALIAARLKHMAARGMPLATTHAREATSAPILEKLGFRTEFRYRVFWCGERR